MSSMSLALSSIKIKRGPTSNFPREKANTGLQDLNAIPHSSRSAFIKDIEVYVAVQREACPDHQASANSTTSCAKHRRMSERGETDSRSIGSTDKFLSTAVRRNVVNHQTRHKDANWTFLRKEESLECDHKPKCLEF
ncbi:hypothetical protein TNCV_1507951 [Trichonephila clavipes]|nr:hypothetical protein TNCV_1507951 [Trichonephila clavipes]